ncbi:MAG: hypothetical protein HW419_363 [Deltaproteobacteria bacterium]|nr:hypothetical protein [Deltaproteobacteria bacterium]
MFERLELFDRAKSFGHLSTVLERCYSEPKVNLWKSRR